MSFKQVKAIDISWAMIFSWKYDFFFQLKRQLLPPLHSCQLLHSMLPLIFKVIFTLLHPRIRQLYKAKITSKILWYEKRVKVCE